MQKDSYCLKLVGVLLLNGMQDLYWMGRIDGGKAGLLME